MYPSIHVQLQAVQLKALLYHSLRDYLIIELVPLCCWLKTSLEGGLEFLVGYRGFGFHSYDGGGGGGAAAAANVRRLRGKLSLVDFPLIRFPLFISRPNCVSCAGTHWWRRGGGVAQYANCTRGDAYSLLLPVYIYCLSCVLVCLTHLLTMGIKFSA